MGVRQVALLGLGLIGCSVGLALKRSPDSPRVLGFDIQTDSLRRAARAGAIDRSAGTLAEVCDDSDLIVLAAPVRAILSLLPGIAAHVKAGTLVTDTGSTKAEIVRAGSSVLPPGVGFVGGHPLAGRLTAGTQEASPNLFQGVTYCLTPSPDAEPWAVEGAIHFVESLGAQPYFLQAEEHDALLAATSHLPYFTSVALVNAVASQASWPETSLVAAGGFRTASSLAEGDPQVWADIGLTNRENVGRQIEALVDHLQRLRELVLGSDVALVDELQAAHDSYQKWLGSRAPDSSPPGGTSPPASGRSRSFASFFRRS